MNPKDKRCIWEYCKETCEHSECENCPYYKKNYANTKKQLENFKTQGKSAKYLINYMLSMEQYDETHVLSAMVSIGYDEKEIVKLLEYDFAIDMSYHPLSVTYE